jgi:D-glycero-alpha-D-manno-heptose-7-phosphate kinase
MIISRTPLRISFFSGGSDMPSFFLKERGAALSVTIDKYIYVMAHKTPHLGIKTMYDVVEQTADIELMQHAITRESLKMFNVDNDITLASISDILSRGSGLGSSSAFTVGLLNCLAKGNFTREKLAQKAYFVERNLCGYPVGKQDQYAAAYGGMNLFQFETDDVVTVRPVVHTDDNWDKLQDSLLLVYSGRGRNANSILQKQAAAMAEEDKFKLVKRNRDRAFVAANLFSAGLIDDFGALFHDAWMDKKGLAKDITDDYFDSVYNKAIKAGAVGGKLLGAGGGGFFLFYVKPNNRERVIHAITNETSCKVYNFKFVEAGSTIVTSC